MSPDIEIFFSGNILMVFTIWIYTKGRLAGPLLVWTLRVWPLNVGPLWVRHLWIWHLWVRTRAEPWCWRLGITGLVVGSWCHIRRSSWTLAIVGRRHSKGISLGWPVDIVVKRIVLPHYRVDWLVLGHVSFPHLNPDIDRKTERLTCTEKESN